MKQTQKIEVIYKGVIIYTKRNKLASTFDYYTAQAVEFACKAIDDNNRMNKEKIEGIGGNFGTSIQRDIQVRIVK